MVLLTGRSHDMLYISHLMVHFSYLCNVLKMNFWLVLVFGVLAKCRCQESGACPCPDLSACSFGSSSAEVECSGSSLTRFPPCGFPANTTRLSIRSTNISSVTASHLNATPRLRSLQLYHNKLAEVPPDMMKGVPGLNELDLTGNQLVLLPADVFRHVSLHSLVLKNNQIAKVDADWFADNSSLTWLDLSGNRLTDLPAALFHKLPLLENLDLSDNRLQELHRDAFRGLRHLKTLNLAGNRLSLLESSIFTSNLNLSQLFLQENRLQGLPADLLGGLLRLELLLLNQNRLLHLPPGFLDRNASFRVILSGNPWLCDEKMEYLWQWLTVHPQNVLFREEVTCAGPETLRHRQVVSLTRSELGLQP